MEYILYMWYECVCGLSLCDILCVSSVFGMCVWFHCGWCVVLCVLYVWYLSGVRGLWSAILPGVACCIRRETGPAPASREPPYCQRRSFAHHPQERR